MSTPSLISIEEYLASRYEPDCDFVDGHLEEHNGGERTHSKLQGRLIAFLVNRYEAAGMEVFPEVRVRVAPPRVRIPDICVTVGDPNEDVATKADGLREIMDGVLRTANPVIEVPLAEVLR